MVCVISVSITPGVRLGKLKGKIASVTIQKKNWRRRGILLKKDMELNKIYQGDCLELMKGMADKSVDLVLTDPPYGIGADSKGFKNGTSSSQYEMSEWDSQIPSREVFDEMRRVSKNQIIFGGNYFLEYLKNTRCFIIWDKGTGDNSYADAEIAWTSFDRVIKIVNKVWVGANAKERFEKRLHPTQKPVEVMEWILMNFSEEGMTILDPFAGSGTTCVAAQNLHRNFIGIEISEKYVEIARDRLRRVPLL